MMVTDLKYVNTGDYVTWSKDLNQAAEYGLIPEQWVYEPKGCILEVTKIPGRTEEDDFELELLCVSECGQHTCLSINEQEFDDLYLSLGESPMVRVDSFSSILDLTNRSQQVLDLELEAKQIYQELLESGA